MQKRLPHALLLHVPEHSNLEPLLRQIAALIFGVPEINNLTDEPDIACLEAQGQQIKLEDLRRLLAPIYLTSYRAKAKIITISPLENLNRAAANAFLKILEEPPEDCYFLLISHRLNWLIPTLKSRLQTIKARLSNRDKLNYLHAVYHLSEVDSLKALRIARGDLKIIDKIKQQKDFWRLRRELITVLSGEKLAFEVGEKTADHYQDILYWLLSFVADAYFLLLGVSKEQIANSDQVALLRELAKKHQSLNLYRHYQSLLRLKDLDGRHINVNQSLAISAILLKLSC